MQKKVINSNLIDTSISVVIPVREETKLLERALNSLFVQTLTPQEIVLIDDNIDIEQKIAVKKIVKDFSDRMIAAKISSTLVLKSSAGVGVSAARNLGVKYSKGAYIAFLDADDYFLPEKLEIQVGLMRDTGSDISHTNYFMNNTETGTSRIVDTSFNRGYKQESVISFRDCGIATPTVMIKRSFLKGQNEIFPADVAHGEDLVAWARLCYISNKPLIHLAQSLTVVTVNRDSSASSPINTKFSKDLLSKHALILGIKPLKFYQYGGMKKLIIQLLPLSNKKMSYFLNLISAIKGK
jgi:glycosyltransferase involved in cell wall biosynthesis